MGKIGVVMNPGSGHGLAARLEPWLRLRLGNQVDIHRIMPGVDACAWARNACESGFDRIVVIGGDGTFRSIAGAMIGMETPLGLIATGTNNNISSTLGLPPDPHEAAEIALTGKPQWVSAGRIGDYVFFEGAGIGLEADLWPVGEAIVRHQFKEMLHAPMKLARDRAVEIEIQIDGPSKVQKVRAFTMTISNTPMTGAHLLLAPGIDIRDEPLYLTVYHDLGRLQMIASANQIKKGHHGHGYSEKRYPFMSLKVSAAKPMHVHADGTLIGTLPIEVISIPKAIRVAYPEPGTVQAPPVLEAAGIHPS
jgi:diacylglycerol kinase family enzyme